MCDFSPSASRNREWHYCEATSGSAFSNSKTCILDSVRVEQRKYEAVDQSGEERGRRRRLHNLSIVKETRMQI